MLYLKLTVGKRGVYTISKLRELDPTANITEYQGDLDDEFISKFDV